MHEEWGAMRKKCKADDKKLDAINNWKANWKLLPQWNFLLRKEKGNFLGGKQLSDLYYHVCFFVIICFFLLKSQFWYSALNQFYSLTLKILNKIYKFIQK